MKTFAQNVVAILLSLHFVAPSAQAYDVFGKDSNFIKVVQSEDGKQVGFQFCSLKGEFECRQIGKKTFYSKKALQNLRSSEKWDIIWSFGADVLIVLGTAATGGAVAYAGATTVAGSIYGTAAAAAASGATAGTLSIHAVDAVNPYEQYMQIQTLNSDVLDDKRVDVDYAIADFCRRLEAVLDNLK